MIRPGEAREVVARKQLMLRISQTRGNISQAPKASRFIRDEDVKRLIIGELAELSAWQQRVALTRDVGLLKRSIVQHGYSIRHTNPELQAEPCRHSFGPRFC